jgi:hypothetical protein
MISQMTSKVLITLIIFARILGIQGANHRMIDWNPRRQWVSKPHRSGMGALSTGHIGIRGANPLILEDSNWLLLWKAVTIGPMSADQHKQIGIRRGATSFNMSTVHIKQNVNIEKSQKLKGRSEK